MILNIFSWIVIIVMGGLFIYWLGLIALAILSGIKWLFTHK